MPDADLPLPPSNDQLAGLHARLLRAVAYRLGGPDAAEDAAQEAMLLLWQRWPEVVRGAHERARGSDPEAITNQLVAWVATCAVRMHGEALRRSRRRSGEEALLNEQATPPDQGAAADLSDLERDLTEKLAAFRASLNARERAVFDAVVAQTPREEVARALDTSPNAVWQVAKRLRQKLGRDERLRAIHAAMRVARDGSYGSAEDCDLVEATLATPAHDPVPCRLDALGLRWHGDGYVRAELRARADTPPLPEVVVGVGWLSGKPHQDLRAATTPFVLHWQGQRAHLDAFVGTPPHHDGGGDGIRLPARHLHVVLSS